jgi:DNA (cytosine-5)-methyltransferase 1
VNRSPFINLGLFAGAGGLTIGLAEAGIETHHVYELDDGCCTTLERNSTGPDAIVRAEIHNDDVSSVDWSKLSAPVGLLAGGPPCQPFSRGGKHLGNRDGRDEFPAIFRAVRALSPAIVLLENVFGLLRPSFEWYLEYVERQLAHPSCAPLPEEEPGSHLARLRALRGTAAEYRVVRWTFNSADFGVAQVRLRVFLVAVRVDLPSIVQPIGTHSRGALLDAQRDGSYWKARGLKCKKRESIPVRAAVRSNVSFVSNPAPWVTVRDALAGLPAPATSPGARDNHWLIPGARLYRGHTGSELDWPAKTIKAGVHGVPGGENVVLLDDGTHRYFTLREMARIQGFPDRYEFPVARSRAISQIGNAVPCPLARAIGRELAPRLAPDVDTSCRFARQSIPAASSLESRNVA